ncbi:UDP-N-acetylglucosamine--LPS N-acetylglucosamine transferase [uncultured Litoreibacter sp.]|uniref:UDP-N-acetylglucosamine--LPS N-acetylglucosamine transferase n=1 Tax=uncultured Litoreibacter sp. TaxID=1392394 RepID=UPI00261B6140|nr:UDP-N-acetylglucosamine--LPS N-acetylglucosamine transferase [uncultured Litoreibacter sp.]
MSGGVKRVLAVASQGGHWRQLSALAGAFEGHICRFVSTSPELGDYCVRDCSRSKWWLGFITAVQLAWIIGRYRPDVVVSTGALPGLLSLIVARAFGARTIWIDSVANTERMSLSGRLCRPFAGLWLTQWPKVSAETGAEYAGSVL